MDYKPGDRISGPECLGPKVGYVYVFRCPDTGDVRYVGSTVNPASRYVSHLHDASGIVDRGLAFGSKREKWIASLILSGKFPVMEIVSVHPVKETVAAERELWSHYMSAGADLINSTTPSHNVKYGYRHSHPIARSVK